jgi:DNA-binding CsgD family transcriptional regulator
VVLRPWYYSNAAILVYVLLGLIIAASIPLIQRKKFRREKSKLNQNKEEELKLKNEKINQISIESKNEIDKVLNEKLQSEIDLKNDQLTTITLQLINNNEFIRDIRSDLEQNMNKRGAAKDYLKIIRTIDDKLSNGDYWDKFEYHFDQVHGDYLKKLAKSNIKLSPREIKLAAFLRMNMSSKEISSLMNITPRSVELARHRLRKKLKLTRDQNLVEYLIELDNT